MTDLEKNYPTKSEYTLLDGLQDLRSALNIVILEVIAAVTAFTIYMAIKHNVSDTLMIHICFCVIGYGLLMTSAISLFSGNNIFGRPLLKSRKAYIHGWTLGAGAALSITGVLVEIISRGDEYPHFTSTHAITGLVSIIILVVAVLAGLLTNYIHKLIKVIPIKAVWYKIFHNLLGLLTYVVGMCSICYGFETWWFNSVGSEDQKIVAIAAVAVVTIWTAATPFVTLSKYFKIAFEN